MDQHFGIRLALENTAIRLEFPAERPVIVNLAIEGHGNLAIKAQHRLRAGWREINDGQAAMTKTDAVFRINPFAKPIGSARPHEITRAPQNCRIDAYAISNSENSVDATHNEIPNRWPIENIPLLAAENLPRTSAKTSFLYQQSRDFTKRRLPMQPNASPNYCCIDLAHIDLANLICANKQIYEKYMNCCGIFRSRRFSAVQAKPSTFLCGFCPACHLFPQSSSLMPEAELRRGQIERAHCAPEQFSWVRAVRESAC